MEDACISDENNLGNVVSLSLRFSSRTVLQLNKIMENHVGSS